MFQHTMSSGPYTDSTTLHYKVSSLLGENEKAKQCNSKEGGITVFVDNRSGPNLSCEHTKKKIVDFRCTSNSKSNNNDQI